jgi:hypothetical protein
LGKKIHPHAKSTSENLQAKTLIAKKITIFEEKTSEKKKLPRKARGKFPEMRKVLTP